MHLLGGGGLNADGRGTGMLESPLTFANRADPVGAVDAIHTHLRVLGEKAVDGNPRNRSQ